MAVRELIFDQWTSLSFKRAMQKPKDAGELHGQRWRLPSWIGSENERRLTAYTVLQAYIDNAAREFLATEDAEQREDHREYGDAAVIVESIVDALLGETQKIVIDEAIAEEPEADAEELLEFFEDWAIRERFHQKMVEVETNSVGLGDAVYVLGWSSDKNRVRVRTYDPGFYFPVLDDMDEDDYPRKVHIAWQIEGRNGEPDRIRRITWELGNIERRLETQAEARERLGFDDDVLVNEERLLMVLHDGDDEDEDGFPVRQYEWNDDLSYTTCFMSDGVWTAPDVHRGYGLDDFDESKAKWRTNGDGEEVRLLDIGVDFIPVIHIPNTIAMQAHFGKSSLSTILQVLDDLSNADTDLQAASATAGSPILALQGSNLREGERPTYRPGEIFETGDGTMNVMSTADALDALLKYIDSLLRRLSSNARLPESILGRIKPSEVPSGLALSLSFGPLVSMVRKMRMVRDEKYPLLLKFIWRMTLANSDEDVPVVWYDSKIQFGRYLPSDRAAVVNEVRELLAVNGISIEQAVKELQAVGYAIDDAVEEVQRIIARDFLNADRLRAALQGQIDEVREFLGMKPLTDDEREKRLPPSLQPGPTDPNAPRNDPTLQDPDNVRPNQLRERQPPKRTET